MNYYPEVARSANGCSPHARASCPPISASYNYSATSCCGRPMRSRTASLRTDALAVDTQTNVAYSTCVACAPAFRPHAMVVKNFRADLRQRKHPAGVGAWPLRSAISVHARPRRCCSHAFGTAAGAADLVRPGDKFTWDADVVTSDFRTDTLEISGNVHRDPGTDLDPGGRRQGERRSLREQPLELPAVGAHRHQRGGAAVGIRERGHRRRTIGARTRRRRAGAVRAARRLARMARCTDAQA